MAKKSHDPKKLLTRHAKACIVLQVAASYGKYASEFPSLNGALVGSRRNLKKCLTYCERQGIISKLSNESKAGETARLFLEN